ncbi:hypothetical protein BKA93DRAFT_747559 [Sparassis latifolia]
MKTIQWVAQNKVLVNSGVIVQNTSSQTTRNDSGKVDQIEGLGKDLNVKKSFHEGVFAKNNAGVHGWEIEFGMGDASKVRAVSGGQEKVRTSLSMMAGEEVGGEPTIPEVNSVYILQYITMLHLLFLTSANTFAAMSSKEHSNLE